MRILGIFAVVGEIGRIRLRDVIQPNAYNPFGSVSIVSASEGNDVHAILRCKSHAKVASLMPAHRRVNPYPASRQSIPSLVVDMNVHHPSRHPDHHVPRPTPRVDRPAQIVGPPPTLRYQKMTFFKYNENKASKDGLKGQTCYICQTAERNPSKDGQLTSLPRVICIWQMVS